MIIQNVPFYSNTPDGIHCFEAVLKMILKHFQPDKDYTFPELDKLTGKVEGKWTWAQQSLINLQKLNFDIVNMEDFDYQEFSRVGEVYLFNKFGYDVASKQIKHSDIKKEIIDSTEFIKVFGNNFALPEFEDIKKFIDKNYLVACNINPYALDNLSGYSGHIVLVFGYDDNFVYLHDPGLPPQPHRQVSFVDFTRAWAYPGHDNQNLIAFNLS
jgi:hypothetical protein